MAGQTDLFQPPARTLEYEVHYHPPEYPEKWFPSRCKHEGPFAMLADLHLVAAKGGGRRIEIDHAICMACGTSQPATYGGNVLVDCMMILASDKATRHWRIAMHVLRIRDRWARIATYLFDEDGWNGKHQRIARMIDPNLTMKLSLEGAAGTVRMGRIKFDPEYLRPYDEET